MSKIYTINSYVLMVVCLFLGGMGTDGGVLCIKASGQVDFELGLQKACISSVFDNTPAGERSASNVQMSEDEGCGECLDVPMGGRVNVRQDSDSHDGIMRLTLVPPNVTSSGCGLSRPNIVKALSASCSHSPASLVATVVLLI